MPTIVPVLEKEYRNASRRLEETQVELNDLHPEKLKVGGLWGYVCGGWSVWWGLQLCNMCGAVSLLSVPVLACT